MELNAIVLSFVLDVLDLLWADGDAVSLRTVSKDFQKTLYDVILKPEAIQEYMRTLFERNRRSSAIWPWYVDPKLHGRFLVTCEPHHHGVRALPFHYHDVVSRFAAIN